MSYGELSNTQETMVLPMLQMKNIRGKPYITVSAKGMINGLSNIPNDGADFGPDTTEGATAPGQYGSPYTETSGIQEAIDYGYPLGLEIDLIGHIFTITASYTLGTYRNFIIKLPSSTSLSSPTSLKIVGKSSGGAMNTILSGVPKGAYTGDQGSVIIDASSVSLPDSSLASWVIGNDNTNSELASLAFSMENIAVIAPGSNNYNSSGIAASNFICSAALFRNVSVSKSFSTNNSDNGGTGIEMTGGGADNSWSDNINIAGFYIGLKVYEQWTVIGSINIVACTFGIAFDNATSHTDNMFTAHFVNFTLCQYPFSVLSTSGAYSVIFNIFSVSIFYDSSNSSYPLSDDTYDPSNYLNGIIYTYIKQDGATNDYVAPSLDTSSNIHIEYVANNNGQYNRYQPSVSIATNPPVSGTTYQNTNAYGIRLKIPVTYSPTSTAAATLATGISSTSTVTTSTKVSIPAGVTAGQILTYDMVVPAGQYYEIVVTNATIGTAEVQAA